ncbi:Cu amine oxidase 1 [Drechslerella stenobrocha 248]|uniref:Amine oxidase n=1 Tax=Drechslerella stenobrocha 248 TaxID=1043628 RepID=W7HW76_9PEZI|nr:Cu amine oxidase 1 [Drechslerella stenobrocha 248]
MASTIETTEPKASNGFRQHHPLDPLSPTEIARAVSIVREAKGQLGYNAVTIAEPKKAQMTAWLAAPEHAEKPARQAEVVAIDRTGAIWDGIVDLDAKMILQWEKLEGVQPLITMEDLIETDRVVKADLKVIEQCGILGIPPSDMHKVYADPWTIGYDERFGNGTRLQQALMYYRPHPDDCQYAFPLDFCPIVNTETKQVIHIDIPEVRRPLNKIPSNYNPKDIEAEGGYRTDIKPLLVTQPQGVSFSIDGREISWQNFKVHVGFNYREGIVLNNITYKDKGTARPLFYRLSLAEMVVPYGNPEMWHYRKHAFDLGEYGGGYMTNELSLGCDCLGEIHYLDAFFVNRAGDPITIKNAICVHEEDAGILFKHTDFRDNSVIVTRGRKLVISHIFTAANYEYCVYWIFHQDGTIQLEIKLTGILNTYAMAPDEDTKGWGTQVHPGVNAHNHEHLFCLRIDPQLDGHNNTVFQVDATMGDGEVGSKENYHGNAFYAKKTKYSTVAEGIADYNGDTSRTWDIANTNKLHPVSGKPVSYKLVSREVPRLLIKDGGLASKRAGFAKHAIHVTKYTDGQIYPAGRHVPQSSGEPSRGLPEWIAANSSENIDNTDIVVWHTFGLVHFPAPEDFPVMPVEPMSLLLRPRHFFLRNPVLDVPPSFSATPTQVREPGSKKQVVDAADRLSRLAFGGAARQQETCCSGH